MSKNKFKSNKKRVDRDEEVTMVKHPAKQPNVNIAYTQKVSSTSVSSVLSEISKKTSPYIPLISFIVFGIVAFIYLAIYNYDYLYSCQEHSIWINTSYFLEDSLRRVGGLSEWLGSYFTQYFYYPSLGSIILILMWGAIYFLTIKSFSLRGGWGVLALAPCVMLLCSEIELGYWIYYIKMPGYWFTYTICVLIMLLGIYISHFLKGYIKSAYVAIYIFALYPIIGVWSLIGGVIMCIQSILQKDKTKYITLGLAIVVILITPFFYYGQYTTERSEDMWTKMFPLFQLDKFIETSKLLPFIGILLFLLILTFVDKIFNRTEEKDETPVKGLRLKPSNTKQIILSLINIALILFYFWSVSFSNITDKNFHSELRMYKLLGDCDWQGVLDESSSIHGDRTRQMIMCQNAALIHKGGIGDEMLKYNNRTIYPRVPTYKKSWEKLAEDKERLGEDAKDLNGNLERDSLHVNLCNTAGPLLYFMYGKCNFAYRWCIENGVEFTFRVDEYKNMIRCAMMTGEYDLAKKYINILYNTTFHKKWAEERLSMLHDKTKYTSSEEYKCIHPLYESFKNALDGDQGLVEMYLINYFSHMNSDNKKFQEATLAFALIQKDIALFWPRFFKYADLHEKEPMPIHYQEAAYLFGHLENKVDISKMPFDKEKIVNRYANFTSMTQQLMQLYGPQYADNEAALTKKVGDECFAEFGDTYWWFYYFSRNVHTY